MSTSIGVGRSTNRSSIAAGREAAREAVAALGGRAPSLVLAFATAGHDQSAFVRGVGEIAGNAKLAGCSAEGVITQRGSEEQSHVAAVTAIASDEIWFETFFAPGFTKDSRACGRELVAWVEEQRREADRRGCLLILFPDGIGGNCRELIETLEEGLPYPLPIVGGTAGDLLAFQRTWQYHRGEVASDGLVAVMVGGAVEPEIVVTHGCDLVGAERSITRAEGGFVYEIDGQPAWRFFKAYLADDTDTLEAMHVSHLLLAERIDTPADGFDDFTVRVPVKLDAESGALYFAAGIRSGTRVQLALRNAEKVCTRAIDAARRITERRAGKRPLLVLELDCAGRGAILFGDETTERLVDPMQRVFGKDLPWIGLHTYGEIAAVGGRTYFHNYTAVLCALYATSP
ncbi:MAG: FIST signal transduction protein [Polyangiales bacterium]